MRELVLLLAVIQWHFALLSYGQDINPWDLPVFPPALLDVDNQAFIQNGIPIPKKMWVARRKRPRQEIDMPEHIQKMFARARNDGWEASVQSNEDQLTFMEEHYANTSTLWAFKIINPRLGVVGCDIWRVALLYAIGGFYLDDDSSIGASLNTIVGPKDTLIVTAEKNLYRDNCYTKGFHLAEARNTRQKYPNFTDADWKNIAGDKMLASWGIFAAPHHPIIREVLQNIVTVIRAEYLRTPLVFMMNTEPRWKIVMCSTGPCILSATIRNYIAVAASNLSSGFIHPPPIRFVSNDYNEYGGVFKVDLVNNGRYPVSQDHYMVAMSKHSIPLLRKYAPFSPALYEGQVVSPGGKKIYWVLNNTLHIFPNYDTITFNGFDMTDVRFIQSWDEFQKFGPEGDPIAACVPNTPNCRR